MKPEFLQLEAGEDVASIRDRLNFMRGKRVLMIWPETGTALTRKLDLVLIQREAMRLAIRLALITHDADVIRNANELNISTFETVGESERAKWKRGRSKVFTSRVQRPKDEPEPEELLPYATRVRAEGERSALGRVFRVLTRAAIIVLLVGVLVFVAVLLIPSATVTLVPAQERLQVEATINADPEHQGLVDVENGVIPANTLVAQVEERGTINTTGVQDLDDTRARGTVIFINRTNGTVNVPAGQLVGTSAGTTILFETQSDITVPAGEGSQMDVAVEAAIDFAGSIGNVESGMINQIVGNDALAERIEVRNVAATVGGEDRAVNIVSADDRDRLLAVLRQQVQDRAYSEMLTRLEDTQFLIPETVRISEERGDWMTFDAEIGDVADTLTLSMRAVVTATAIDEQSAQQVAFARLAGQIPRGRGIRPETILYERGEVSEFNPGGRVTFTMISSSLIAEQINVGQLQQSLAGKTPDEAMQYILSEVDLAEGSAPQIALTPDWMMRMPLLPLRIQIRTQAAAL